MPGLRWSVLSREPSVNYTHLHVSILWGGELLGMPASTRLVAQHAIASLAAYGPVYPADVVDELARPIRDHSPWATAGTGFATAWTTRWGGDLRSWSSAMCRSPRFAPRVARSDVHALLGQALLGWCIAPTGRANSRDSPRAAEMTGSPNTTKNVKALSRCSMMSSRSPRAHVGPGHIALDSACPRIRASKRKGSR